MRYMYIITYIAGLRYHYLVLNVCIFTLMDILHTRYKRDNYFSNVVNISMVTVYIATLNVVIRALREHTVVIIQPI